MPEALAEPVNKLPAYSGPVVAFENVSLAFDGKVILKDLSFSVERGETLIILGPAGTGKSVLLKLANGLLGPDSGAIKIFGKDITDDARDGLVRVACAHWHGLPGVGAV